MAELKIYTTQKPNTLCGTWGDDHKTFTTSAVTLQTGNLTLKNDFKDEHTVILMSGAGTVTVKAGTGYAGTKDLVITAPAGVSFMTIDSARFINRETGEINIVAQTTQVGVLSPRV